MSLKIYTFSNPNYLDQEDFWNEIKDAPYFCVTQTLVNGLSARFSKDFPKGRIGTSQNLLNNLYEDWLSTSKIIKQHTDLDSIITQELSVDLDAFAFNRDDLFKSIRVMFELGMEPTGINKDLLSEEQRILFDIFCCICNSKRINDFRIDEVLNDEEITEAIESALLLNVSDEDLPDAKIVSSSLDYSKIVIHGIHQFSPLALRMIETLSEIRDVYLIFPYQDHLKNVYQTWLDIYSIFDSPIHFSENPRKPSLINDNHILGDSIGKILNGQMRQATLNTNVEIIEFNNTTEFANYVAEKFEKAIKVEEYAKKKSQSRGEAFNRSTLSYMDEQFYSADFSVNDVLKVYYPDQFGERHFLNYPLGHFFLAIANMWDEENQCLRIDDLNDIKECLQSHFFSEDYYGELCEIFTKSEVLFSSPMPTTITKMIERIDKLEKRINKKREDWIKKIEYCDLSAKEIAKLRQSLLELEKISEEFFQEFASKPQNFKLFYKNVQGYLVSKLNNEDQIDDNFRDIIERVVQRLEEVKDITASASLRCLINTMNLYLEQNPKKNVSANWIVRNFEQIDGDILLNSPKTLHFACLSDEDINATQKREFPWPLDEDFFERAQKPIDWKYQCYVKSCKEYKNFRRYALIYGLQYCRGKVKLSYIKKNGDHDRILYYPLRLMKLTVKNFYDYIIDDQLEDTSGINFAEGSQSEYSLIDYDRYHLCPFKFVQETLVEGTTVYKDAFLLNKYFETVLKGKAINDENYRILFENCDIDMLNKNLERDYRKMQRYLPFLTAYNKLDILLAVRNSITKNKKFNSELEQTFLRTVLKDETGSNILKNQFQQLDQEQVNEKLNDQILAEVFYKPHVGKWCEFCANKLVCVNYYKDQK